MTIKAFPTPDSTKWSRHDRLVLAFNAGRKQGMKDAAKIISNSSAYWSVSRIKRAIPEAMEKLP